MVVGPGCGRELCLPGDPRSAGAALARQACTARPGAGRQQHRLQPEPCAGLCAADRWRCPLAALSRAGLDVGRYCRPHGGQRRGHDLGHRRQLCLGGSARHGRDRAADRPAGRPGQRAGRARWPGHDRLCLARLRAALVAGRAAGAGTWPGDHVGAAGHLPAGLDLGRLRLVDPAAVGRGAEPAGLPRDLHGRRRGRHAGPGAGWPGRARGRGIVRHAGGTAAHRALGGAGLSSDLPAAAAGAGHLWLRALVLARRQARHSGAAARQNHAGRRRPLGGRRHAPAAAGPAAGGRSAARRSVGGARGRSDSGRRDRTAGGQCPGLARRQAAAAIAERPQRPDAGSAGPAAPGARHADRRSGRDRGAALAVSRLMRQHWRHAGVLRRRPGRARRPERARPALSEDRRASGGAACGLLARWRLARGHPPGQAPWPARRAQLRALPAGRRAGAVAGAGGDLGCLAGAQIGGREGLFARPLRSGLRSPLPARPAPA